LVTPSEIDLVSLVLGDDPTASPYPEQNRPDLLTRVIKDDAQLDKLMTSDALGNLQANRLPYGCLCDRKDLRPCVYPEP